MLRHAQRSLLDMRQGLFACKSHTRIETRFQFPRLELRVNAVARPRHDDDADSRLVQNGDVPHEHREKRVAHQVVLDFQHKQLTLEAFHVAEHFANETCNLKMLRIEIGCSVVHRK